jgi:hypothetical protein
MQLEYLIVYCGLILVEVNFVVLLSGRMVTCFVKCWVLRYNLVHMLNWPHTFCKEERPMGLKVLPGFVTPMPSAIGAPVKHIKLCALTGNTFLT